MFKVLIGNFDLTDKALVSRTMTDLWTLQDIHAEELNEANLLNHDDVPSIKQKIANTDHDLDILCESYYGKLER